MLYSYYFHFFPRTTNFLMNDNSTYCYSRMRLFDISKSPSESNPKASISKTKRLFNVFDFEERMRVWVILEGYLHSSRLFTRRKYFSSFFSSWSLFSLPRDRSPSSLDCSYFSYICRLCTSIEFSSANIKKLHIE